MCNDQSLRDHVFMVTTSIGADSTGVVGKMPQYPQHNQGKSIIFPHAILPTLGQSFLKGTS